MMDGKPYLIITGIFFGIAAILHVFRLSFQMPIQFGEWDLPHWISGVGIAITAALCIWAFLRQAVRRDPHFVTRRHSLTQQACRPQNQTVLCFCSQHSLFQFFSLRRSRCARTIGSSPRPGPSCSSTARTRPPGSTAKAALLARGRSRTARSWLSPARLT